MHFFALLLQAPPDQEMVQKIMLAVVPIILIFYIVGVVVVMVPCWFICKKAGFSSWLSLLCCIPSIGKLVLLYVLAFAEWKVVPAPQNAWQQPPSYPPPASFPPQA
jgi:uncharacterized membrane protein YhaH (DUF805 family)